MSSVPLAHESLKTDSCFIVQKKKSSTAQPSLHYNVWWNPEPQTAWASQEKGMSYSSPFYVSLTPRRQPFSQKHKILQYHYV